MTISEQAAPLVAALAAGIPIGKIKPGEACPTLPAIAMIVLLDDANGDGPEAFDTTKLFAEIDAVVFVTPLAIGQGASAVAMNASKGQRALLVQTPSDCLARWLVMVIGHKKLMANYIILGAGETPNEILELMKDIDQLKDTRLN